MKTKLAMAAAALTLLASIPASAATYIFDSVGDSSVINFNGYEDFNITGLSTQITYTLTGFSGNSATFSYVLDNTSTAPVTAARVTTFGFNIDPNFTSVSNVTGAVYPTVSSGNVPNALPNVEFCLTSGNNCSGGANGGVFLNDPNATGSFKLNFGSQPTTVTLSDLYVRYQAVTSPSQGVSGSSAVGIPVIGVPEPTTWAMMLTGFFGMGSVLRSQRRRRAMTVA